MTRQEMLTAQQSSGELLGALPLPGSGVRFVVWAPRAQRLAVVLLDPPGGLFPMTARADGVFTTVVAAAGAGTDYLYLIDEQRQRPDPASRHQPHGVHGPSRVGDPRAFSWTDTAWRGLPLTEFVLYEVHIGTFTPEGTFEAAIAKLPYLRELGVTAIELMPVAEFPGARNWGYDGVALFAPQSSYGGPEGLKRLVDACHRNGMACVLDVVYNHLGPEGNYLSEFGPYFSDRYRTPWGDAINFDGAQSDGVRRFFIENALHWLRDYHMDALRLDAIHSICDLSAHHILAELQEAFQREAKRLCRRAYLIAESDLNDARIIAPPSLGGYGLDAQWSDDFHHAVYAAVVGDRHGYFSDFQGLSDVATAINQSFVYNGKYSRYRERRHGNSSAGRAGSQFVVCTQNHDQVANASAGRRLGVFLSPAQQKLLACLLILAPNLPLLFMGQEYGELAPFHYFVSHSDPHLIEAVRRGRQREFASLCPQGEFADPQDPKTFLACKLDWAASSRSPHAELLALYRDLLEIRRRHPCLRGCRQDLTRATADAEGRYLLVERLEPAGGCALALFNFSDSDLSIPVKEHAAPLELVITSSDPRYGGPQDEWPRSATIDVQRDAAAQIVRCPAWSMLLYASRPDKTPTR